MMNDDPSVLPDGQDSKNTLGTSKHGLGIGAEKKEAGFLRALPEPVIAVNSRSVAELHYGVIEIEIGVDIIGKGDAIEEDCQTLHRAEPPQHGAVLEDLRTDGCARLLERRDCRREGGVEIGELDLDIGEINPAGLVQLRSAASNTTDSRRFERCLKRVFISFASSHRFEVLVKAGDDQV